MFVRCLSLSLWSRLQQPRTEPVKMLYSAQVYINRVSNACGLSDAGSWGFSASATEIWILELAHGVLQVTASMIDRSRLLSVETDSAPPPHQIHVQGSWPEVVSLCHFSQTWGGRSRRRLRRPRWRRGYVREPDHDIGRRWTFAGNLIFEFSYIIVLPKFGFVPAACLVHHRSIVKISFGFM